MTPWITNAAALSEFMARPQQVDSGEAEAEMPPYMEAFLAHLRLLVGVPFDYLVPDSRLLPDESIRFFYLDRSWTDRLVDGAVAVGKSGTREQAHHQAHAPAVQQQLDLTERIVRNLQRARDSFSSLKEANDTAPAAAQLVTGFLLRSAVVSGWPHMDMRAYANEIPEPFDSSDPAVVGQQLRTLRLERLSPAVLFALFEGVPKLVIFEEPHHGLQFGIPLSGTMNLRQQDGQLVMDASNQPVPITPVPVRPTNSRVIAVAALRAALFTAAQSQINVPHQKGSADFALQVLNPPWRQRFEGVKDQGGAVSDGGFVPSVPVAQRAADPATTKATHDVFTMM